jgi:hypothetical protein
MRPHVQFVGSHVKALSEETDSTAENPSSKYWLSVPNPRCWEFSSKWLVFTNWDPKSGWTTLVPSSSSWILERQSYLLVKDAGVAVPAPSLVRRNDTAKRRRQIFRRV